MDWSDILDTLGQYIQGYKTLFLILGIIACWAAVHFIGGWLGWCLGIAALLLLTILGFWLDSRYGESG